MAGPPSGSFAGTARFAIKRCLGSGGFGTVYEALDQKRNAVVALKVLRHADPQDIYRFKQEFRALFGLTHRNLVTLYEILLEGEQWLLSMELVPGTDFLSYVREQHPGPKSAATSGPGSSLTLDSGPSRPDRTVLSTSSQSADDAPSRARSAARCSLERLLPCLLQLTAGLSFLHDAGMVHRDIKPGNVLCTFTGRVVILDFGLLQELPSALALAEKTPAFAGTPGYMSPEQAAEQPLTAAADFYSVGVLLYEALTGVMPFSGTLRQLVRQKLTQDPLPPSSVRTDVPPELDALCMQLLHRQPERRPRGEELSDRLRALSAQLLHGAPAPVAAVPARLGALPFVGRDWHLAALAEAFTVSRSGQPMVALCHGGSGVGKSALCKRFLKDLTIREQAVLLLIGRCYEHEDLPFKALDGIIDSLSRFLRDRPRGEIEALLPPDMLALARLFPVLLQVPAIKDKQAAPRPVVDGQKLRQAAFLALRELLLRLAEQRPVVLYIDDLQWGDEDGILLLLELLRPPRSPAILLIASYSSAEEEASAALNLLKKGLGGEFSQGLRIQDVPVADLQPEESEALALALITAGGRDAEPQRTAAIATEAGGNAFFVTELSRSFLDGLSTPDGITLDALIGARVARLPESSRRLLSAITIAGHPLPRAAMAYAAYGAAEETDEPQALALLRAERLVRVRHAPSGRQQATLSEVLLPYHDRVRQAVVTALTPTDRAAQHLRLAEALVACAQGEPEQLVFHLQSGGDLSGAARYAIQASELAYQALAYYQAARLCRAALDTGRLSRSETSVIRARLCDALVGAGRPKEAAEAYLALADCEQGDSAFKRQRQAAKQFFLGGYVKEAQATLAKLLPAARLTVPSSTAGLLVSLLFYRFLLAVRGLKFHERREAEVPARDLLRLDTCEAIASVSVIDPLQATSFWTRFLWHALRAGEPKRIAQALCNEAATQSALGAPRARIEHILTTAAALAERVGDPYTIGRVHYIGGQIDFFEGRWVACNAALHRAARILDGGGMEATSLLDFSGFIEIVSLRWMGDLPRLAEKVPPYLRIASERGRQSQELLVRLSGDFLLALRDDEPARAEKIIRSAELRLAGQPFNTQHAFALEAELTILLYQGRGAAAWRLLSDNKKAIAQARSLRMPMFQAIWQQLRARVALAAGQPLHLAMAEVRPLERGRCVYAPAASVLIRALVCWRQEKKAEALALLRQAEQGFIACDMPLHAACIRLRLGQWLDGEDGAEPRAAARAWMRDQGIINPEAMAAMLT